MGWNNPPVLWADLERALSGRTAGRSGNRDEKQPGDGGDSPAWARHRDRYEPPSLLTSPQFSEIQPRIPYAELHCHSNFSFLDGASHPEELVEEAARLGLDAIAITDHDGMYGVVRFAEAARELGIKTVFGAELSL
ncbi:MAG: PHP domain-containing protein, partial [Pseudonocardiaceae bacterium]